ncbi:MAG: hypothetical protein H0W72_11400 [Planctomycetes bacterium]|nr:hypothetical protein [Planctomycetota bacterium]
MGKRCNLGCSYLAVVLALSACGGGGGGGGGGGKSGGTSSSTGPIDIRLYGVHLHQDFYNNPRYPAFYFSVRNDGDASARNLHWVVRRLDGANPVEKRGTIADVPAHADVHTGHDVHVEWAEPNLAPGRYTYEVALDPDAAMIQETDRSNNSYRFIMDIPPGIRPPVADDIKFQAREPHFHALLREDDKLDFHFLADNTASTPAIGMKWRLRCDSTSPKINITRDLAVVPGNGSIEDSVGVFITDPGDHEVVLSLEAEGNTDGDTGNNTHTFIVHVPGPGMPKGSG